MWEVGACGDDTDGGGCGLVCILVKGMKRRCGGWRGRAFCLTCVCVPILITAVHHWGVKRIIRGRTEGGREKLTEQWSDSFLTSGPSKVMTTIVQVLLVAYPCAEVVTTTKGNWMASRAISFHEQTDGYICAFYVVAAM